MKPLLIVGRTRYRLPLSAASAAEVRRAARRARRPRRSRARPTARADDATFTPLPPLRRGARRAAFYAALPFRVARELRALPAGRRARRRARTRRRRRCSRRRLARRGRRSSSSSTATGARRRGSTARRSRARCSPGHRPRRAVGGAPRRRRAHGLDVHDRPRRASSASSRRPTFTAFMDLDAVPRTPPVAAARASRGRSSSACSSATRTSTASPRPGGSSPSACPTRRCGCRRRARGATSRDALVERSPRVTWTPGSRRRRSPARSTRACARCSRRAREGSPRIVLEAFCRGRAVVGARVGGIAGPRRATASTACSSTRTTSTASPTRSSAVADKSRAARPASGRGRARRSNEWSSTPEEYAGATSGARRRGGRWRGEEPRVLFVGAHALPAAAVAEPGAQKWDALGARSTTACSRARPTARAPDDDTFELVARAAAARRRARLLRSALPFRVARELRDFRPDAVIVARRARRRRVRARPRARDAATRR